ncbi:FAD-dependent oxidoreductase [Aliiroseovarius sp.]|uniref:FAD-dependent oxidoreductase n=1 Tax=Aliiroseovarius sp. TaxID=1872442 RepID=UPI003BA89251
MKIAIAGAGIGGLAAACYLARDGHDVTLFDQFDAPRPVGSGLVIQPVGLDVLEEIGAGAAALAAGARITRMQGHEAKSGRPVLFVSYDRGGDGAFGLSIHRAALFDALLQAARAAGIEIVTGARVTGASGGWITLASGAREGPFDLVVDASGANSALSPLKSRALPFGAIWGTIDWPDQATIPTDELRQKYRRARHMIGAMPVGRMPGCDRPKGAIFWSMPHDAHADWRAAGLEVWKAEATTLWPEFAPFLEGITDPDQMTMARYSHGTLRRPYGDRIAFIGDAAHRASPQLGQGANMALLDARALAVALRLAPVETAFRSTPRHGAGMCGFINGPAPVSRRSTSPTAVSCRSYAITCSILCHASRRCRAS